MFYKKSYNYGKLGLKGTPSIANKLIGGAKYAGFDLSKAVTNHIGHEVEKKLSNYLEKSK